MPDLSAGTTVNALDTPPTAPDSEPTDETGFTDTTYAQGASVCGVVFTAPTSGRVLVLWHARFESNTPDVIAYVSAGVRAGGVIGSGASANAASDSTALSTTADATGGTRQRQSAGMFRVVTGLTPGNIYNAVTEHRMTSAGNGDIFDRSIAVIPLP